MAQLQSLTTAKLLDFYSQESQEQANFLSSFFIASEDDFHDSEEVHFDEMRYRPTISVPVPGIESGYRNNQLQSFSPKSFKPVVYKERLPLNSYDLMTREYGTHNYSDLGFQEKLVARVFRYMREQEKRFRRTIELHAAQIWQTAQLDLTDDNGNAIYTLDFNPKPEHFPTAAVSWATATADQIADDLIALANEIKKNGQYRPNILIFGENALEYIRRNQEFMQRFDIRRVDEGSMVFGARPDIPGGVFHGIMSIGNHVFEVWTCDESYDDPVTGAAGHKDFVEKDKVIMLSSRGDYRATFGNIPNIGQMAGLQSDLRSVLPDLFGRYSMLSGTVASNRAIDMHVNTWVEGDGTTAYVGVSMRPLLIPASVDTFGCLTAVP